MPCAVPLCTGAWRGAGECQTMHQTALKLQIVRSAARARQHGMSPVTQPASSGRVAVCSWARRGNTGGGKPAGSTKRTTRRAHGTR
eukprot:1904616-Alexandrium_andersonii.AAC.1